MKTIMNLCVECASKSFGTIVVGAVKDTPKALAKCDVCSSPNEVCFEMRIKAYNQAAGYTTDYAVDANHPLLFPFKDGGVRHISFVIGHPGIAFLNPSIEKEEEGWIIVEKEKEDSATDEAKTNQAIEADLGPSFEKDFAPAMKEGFAPYDSAAQNTIPQGMKLFNIERALAGDPVVMRIGKKIASIYYIKETKSEQKILGICEEGHTYWFSDDGKWDVRESAYDLFMAAQEVTIWNNIYHNGDNVYYSSGGSFDTKGEAESFASSHNGEYVGAFPITFPV